MVLLAAVLLGTYPTMTEAREIDLETRLASSAHAWRSVASEVAEEARAAAERQFAGDLEVWIASLLPASGSWKGRWYDGLLFEPSVSEGDEIRVCGWIFQVDTQTRHPFQAELILRGEGLPPQYVVLFGDATLPGGHPTQRSRFFMRDSPKQWMFRFEQPPNRVP